ncbi:hypothetical protein [Actinophytocola glycyrrhizae]|uniref:Uncharacterized protein n=1 Tax=Actinophytocola glycyrrhizae TaxID=2044873 RepID=A0ABV9RSL5_9PSEU
MRNTLPRGAPTRFEVVVACAVSVPLGMAALVVLGMAMLVVVPGPAVLVVAPVVLDVAAVGGGWLVARGGLPAKGFGAGVLTGWALLALLSAGASAGLGILS